MSIVELVGFIFFELGVCLIVPVWGLVFGLFSRRSSYARVALAVSLVFCIATTALCVRSQSAFDSIYRTWQSAGNYESVSFNSGGGRLTVSGFSAPGSPGVPPSRLRGRPLVFGWRLDTMRRSFT